MSEPTTLPPDYEHLAQWMNLVRHIDSVIIRGALQWVEIGVFIDPEGRPQFWSIEKPRNLSPKSREIEIKD